MVALALVVVSAVVVAGPAAAASASRSARAADPIAAQRHLDLSAARQAVLRALRPTTTAPRAKSGSTVSPSQGVACSGDSRNPGPPQPAGRKELVPASFGSSYSCNTNTWTFWVDTSDTFDPLRFGAWTILVDTDGSGLFAPLAANCYGAEYMVAGYRAGDGSLGARVVRTSGDCATVVSSAPATLSLSSQRVSVSFSADALVAVGPRGDTARAPSLEWAGTLSTLTEVVSNQPGTDVPATGTVSDSIPLEASPPACSVSSSAIVANASVPTPVAGKAAVVARGVAAPALAPPNDPGYGAQWSLSAVRAPQAWSVTTGDSGVAVADIDTGINGSHPDLAGKVGTGVDVTGPTPTLVAPGTDNDVNGRGTAVAGSIAAATDNGIGLASLGWRTRVVPVKASVDGTFAPPAVAAGIEWVVRSAAAANPGLRVRVINLPMSGPCDDPGVRQAIADAQAAGILVVAAAGNGARYAGPGRPPGDDYTSFPASVAGVVAVAALGRDGYRARSSQTGPYVTIAAPGGSGDLATPSENLSVLGLAGGYTVGSGSALSSALVASTAALLWAHQPTWTPGQILSRLKSSADDIGAPGPDLEYGAGALNAGRALSAAGLATQGTFFAVTPTRVLDTRVGIGSAPRPIGAAGTIDFATTGLGEVPATGVASVILHVTAVNGTQPTYLTLWPSGTPRPLASNINAGTDSLANNLVVVPLGAGASVSVFNASGTTDVVADITGWFSDGTAALGSTFVGTTPTRLVDTRDGTGAPKGPLGPDGRIRMAVSAAAGGPVPTGATAAVVNLTAVAPSAGTFLQAYAGPSPPGTAALNATAGQIIANLAVIPIASDGYTTIRNGYGTTNVVVDVVGYFAGGAGLPLHSLSPVRVLDTRDGTGGTRGPVAGGSPITVTMTGPGGIPPGAVGVVVNVTVTNPTAPGFLSVYPADLARPLASNLNFVSGETVPNLVAVRLSPSGQLTIFNSAGMTDVVIDVAGWFG